MMKLKMLSSGQNSLLKGALAATMMLSAGIAAGVIFRQRRRKAEPDRLENNTAKNGPAFAAVIRRSKKDAADTAGTADGSAGKMPYYEAFSQYQRQLDNAGKRALTEAEWAALEREMLLLQKEREEVLQKAREEKAQVDAEIERLKLRALAKKAAELAD